MNSFTNMWKLALSVGCIAMAMAGCGESTTQSGDDAGTGSDTGISMDAGDAGPHLDMSTIPDMAHSDSTVLPDTGPPVDMGVDLGIDASVVAAHLREVLCDPVATALCASYATCGCDVLGAMDMTACVREQSANCGTSMDDIAYNVATGGMVIDETLLTACASELSSVVGLCANLDGSNAPSCYLAFSSTLAIGSGCESGGLGNGCARGAGYCDGTTGYICREAPSAGESCTSTCTGSSVCRSGVCGDRIAAGSSCARSSECATGLVCATAHCVAPSAVGGSCDEARPCHVGLTCTGGTCVDSLPSCTDSSTCGPEASCRGADVYECHAIGGEGTPCSGSDACIEGTACNYSTGVCVAAPGESESCESISDCANGYYCDYASGSPTCRVLPGVGEECAGGGIIIGFRPSPTRPRPSRGSRCADGLGCFYSPDGSPGLCQPLPSYGELCSGFGECADGLGCVYPDDGSDATCQPPPAPGERCYTDNCIDGYYCAYDESIGTSTCAPQFGPGEPCGYSEMCVPGMSCIYETSGAAFCGATPSFGEECPSGECVDGAYCAYALRDATCLPGICDMFSGGGVDTPPPPGGTPGASGGGSAGSSLPARAFTPRAH